jgi:hypothetical protein
MGWDDVCPVEASKVGSLLNQYVIHNQPRAGFNKNFQGAWRIGSFIPALIFTRKNGEWILGGGGGEF